MGSWESADGTPAAQLAPYLRPGEKFFWSGRPDPDVRFSRADVFLVPFTVMWGGFAVFWEVAVLASGFNLFFALWGIPFVAMGLYLLFGRFIYKRRTKLRTAYGVTSDRALVAIGNMTLYDSPLKQIPTAIRRSRDGSHASITFGNQSGWSYAGRYANTGLDFFMRGSPPVAFYDVADAQPLLAALDQAAGQ
jgi:hypothetical protein